jgi:ABC-type glycerol-3-phosphate transport system substrate-binding protein
MKTGSDTPDVGRITSYSFPELIATGNVKPLDEVVAKEKIDPTDWLLPLEMSKINGKLWGMPQDFRIPVLMYRKSVLSAAKVDPPATWAEACTAGGKLATATVTGFAMPLGQSGGVGGAQALGEYVISTMLAPDGKYFAPDGRNIAFSKETFVRAAQTIKDLYGKCKATPSTSIQFGYNEIHDGLRAGTVAMSSFGLARFAAIRRQGAGDDLGWAPAPTFTPADKQTVFGFQLMQNVKSKHPDEAWAFIKFMTGTQGQVLQAEGGEVVARASAYKDAYFSKPESANQQQWAKLISARGQTVAYSVILSTYHQIVGEALQRMILRDGTPDAAYQEVISKYNEALAKVK